MIVDAYNKEFNARFINCPKCAWTSVRESYNFKRINVETIPDDCIKFFITRDPYDRITSQFKEVILKDSNYGPNINHSIYVNIIRSISSQEDINKKVEMFFDAIDKYGFFDTHLLTQVYYINNPKLGRQKIKIEDIVFIDFNNMQEELNALFSTDVELKHYNKGLDFDVSIFDDYRSKTEKIYKKDIELYNSIMNNKESNKKLHLA